MNLLPSPIVLNFFLPFLANRTIGGRGTTKARGRSSADEPKGKYIPIAPVNQHMFNSVIVGGLIL